MHLGKDHLTVTTLALNCHFSGPFSTERPAVFFWAKMLRNLSPSVLTFIAIKILKLSSTFNFK